MLTFERPSSAPAAAAWPLLARPDRWHDWAPHVRGAWGLGSPEVVGGRMGFVRVLGTVLVPVRIVEKRDGRSWTWEVAGIARMTHRVAPAPGGGSVVAIDLEAPGPLEGALGLAYGPVIRWALGRLAVRAAGGDSPSS